MKKHRRAAENAEGYAKREWLLFSSKTYEEATGLTRVILKFDTELE